MVPPHNRSVVELAREEGFSEGTLYIWRRACETANASLSPSNPLALPCPLSQKSEVKSQRSEFCLLLFFSSYLLSPVFCLLSSVFCILYSVSCLLSPVFCLLSPVSCLLPLPFYCCVQSVAASVIFIQ